MKQQFLIIAVIISCLNASIEEPSPASDIQLLVTFHPHLHPFWINSFEELSNINWRPDQILYGQNQRNSKSIYNQMYESLTVENKTHRRYFFTEIAFLQDWFEWADETKRETVKELVRNGQLEFPNSGWVENDQATCYYDDIIEQYTIGMNYVADNFGHLSKAAWATDGYGHSHSQAALLNELGFEMQGIQRTDQRFIFKHADKKPLLEFYWKAVSDSNNITYGGIMTHIRHFPHALVNFRNSPETSEIQSLLPIMKKLYGKNILFRYFGSDLSEVLPSEFNNLEEAMNKINQKTQCKSIRYGNPSDYLQKLKEYYQQNPVQTRSYDFFPNMAKNYYWTGYYSVFPRLKKACRDYSRLLNFAKKDTMRAYAQTPGADLQQTLKQLTEFERLNALMQHHNGITGTAKHSILSEMIDKMLQKQEQMDSLIKETNSLDNMKNCQIHKNHYECQISETTPDNFSLVLLSSGTQRQERIEVVLPDGKYYKVTNQKLISHKVFCFDASQKECRIVIEMIIKPGTTYLKFEKEAEQKFKGYAITPFNCPDRLLTFGKSFKLAVRDTNVITYTFGDKVVNISFVTSQCRGGNVSYSEWDRFGNQLKSSGSIKCGLYSMSNNGKLESYGGKVKSFGIMRADKYAKVIITFENNLKTTFTIHQDRKQILDIITDYKPSSASDKMDYFMKIQSNFKSSKDMYHDANGYLVIKRIFDERPDYEYTSNQETQLNANTYPATSFAYIKNDKQKLVVGLDRAEGITMLSSSDGFLVNFDRITDADVDGAGDDYQETDWLRFRHRIAIVDAKNDIERVWQKENDEAIIGYYGVPQSLASNVEANQRNDDNKYLKFTLALLNEHSVILRLQNLAEFKSITVKLFENKKITLSDFGFELDFVDIVESFHNGVILHPTYEWMNLGQNVVDIHKNTLEQDGNVELKPLQIRSFRVDFDEAIIHIAPMVTPVSDHMHIKHLTEHGVIANKRCY